MTFSRPEGEQQQARPSSIDDQIKEIDARLAKNTRCEKTC